MKTALLAALALTACAHTSTIVRFDGSPTPASPQAQNEPQTVEIYRSRGPYTDFKEMGLITYRSSHNILSGIYEQLREDAGKAGANAIIDLKLTSETHRETRTEEKCEDKQQCDFEGNCYTDKVCHNEEIEEDVTTYLAAGTMIKGVKR